MSEWKEYKFEEFYLEPSKNGLSKPSKIRGYGYKMINMGELFSNDFIRDIDMELVPLTDKEKKSGKIEENDLLFARQSLTLEGAGKCSIVIETSPLTVFESHLIRVRLNQKLASPIFFYYYFKSKTNPIKNIVTQAVQAGIKASELATVKVRVPSLSEQKKIAAILSSLDEKIETNRKINARLEELAQALFKSWFIDFEPFGSKMPEDWEEVTLSDIGNIIGGATPSKDHPEYYTSAGNGIAWLTPKDLSDTNAKFTSHGSNDITALGYQKCSTKIMPRGSILFSSRAPIGYVSIALNEICTNQGFKSFIPKKIGTAFAYYLLKALTPEIENKSTGSTFKEASGSLMKSLHIFLPNKEILCKFEEICKPIFNAQLNCEKESSRLAELRDTLLPKLMSGELIPE